MKKHKAKVLWESDGKTPDGNPFTSIKLARNYYSYSERGGMDSIAFILYDSVTKEFLLINESKPPMDERNGFETRMTTAFGGSIDSEHTFKQICKIEVLEESGYDVPEGNITSVGSTLVSSQMSQMCELFLVNVSGIKKTHKAEYEQPDDSNDQEFGGNSVIWMNSDDLMENGDWKSVYILAQSIIKGLV